MTKLQEVIALRRLLTMRRRSEQMQAARRAEQTRCECYFCRTPESPHAVLRRVFQRASEDASEMAGFPQAKKH